MRKNVKGLAVELVSIQKMTGVISDTQQGRLQDLLSLSAGRLNDIQKQTSDLQSLVSLLKTFVTGGHFCAREWSCQCKPLDFTTIGAGCGPATSVSFN